MTTPLKEELANLAQTTLNGGITNSQTTVTLASITGFPNNGYWRLLVDNEIMLVTAVSGAVCTVIRGAESSSPSSHANGAIATAVTTAGQLDGLHAGIFSKANYADLPTASQGSINRLWFPGDNRAIYHDDRSTIKPYMRLRKLNPPTNSGLTWQYSNSATLTDTGMWYIFANWTGTGSDIRWLGKSVPATPYSVAIYQIPQMYEYQYPYHANTYPQSGLVLYEASSGKFVSWFVINGGGSDIVQVNRWSSRTVYNTSVYSQNQPDYPGAFPWWFKIRVDSTFLWFYLSKDGDNWTLVYGEPKTTWFSSGPTMYGLGLNVNGGAGGEFAAMSVLSWEEGS